MSIGEAGGRAAARPGPGDANQGNAITRAVNTVVGSLQTFSSTVGSAFSSLPTFVDQGISRLNNLQNQATPGSRFQTVLAAGNTSSQTPTSSPNASDFASFRPVRSGIFQIERVNNSRRSGGPAASRELAKFAFELGEQARRVDAAIASTAAERENASSRLNILKDILTFNLDGDLDRQRAISARLRNLADQRQVLAEAFKTAGLDAFEFGGRGGTDEIAFGGGQGLAGLVSATNAATRIDPGARSVFVDDALLASGVGSLAKVAGQFAAKTAIKRIGLRNVEVFRVEGSLNTRILVDEGGKVTVQGEQTLFLNFGSKARAKDFLAKRIQQNLPDASVKRFKVPRSVLDDLRSSAVPESAARQFPNRPIIADPTKAPDQFGLRPGQIETLQRQIIQGTGREGF